MSPMRPWLLLVLLALLSACGGGTATVPPASTPVEATAAPTAPAPSEATAASSPAPVEALTGALTVFAAASLTDAFNAIGEVFEAEHQGVTINFSFANAQQLGTQINEGAPADVFATALQDHMDLAINGGRIDPEAVKIFAKNRIIVVTPADNPGKLTSLQDLARPGLRLVLADKVTAAGKYALSFLDKASALPEYGADYRERVLANVRSYEDTVRAAFTKVLLGEADAGIVFSTDPAADRDKVLALDIPDELNTLAVYPIAPLKDTANPALATAFIDFVLGPRGQEILGSYGFQRVN